jgi:hypothetical protein
VPNNTVSFSQVYEIPADDMFVLCGTAIEGLKRGKVLSDDSVKGTLKGTIGGYVLVLHGGSGIEIEIVPNAQEECTLNLEVYPLNAFGGRAPLGGKKSAENDLEEFMGELELRLKRHKTKYGS